MTAGGAAPEGMVRVVAAVLHREGRYLLGRRPARKRHGGLWEFPGGKLDPGESTLDAVRRELLEEMGLLVTAAGGPLLSVMDGTSRFLIEFVEIFAEGTPSTLEHEAVGWFAPGEMLEIPMAPADATFARHLRSDRRDAGRG
ncbi:MAG: NUDIX domain-containing protein [Gemmatimonadota bacterium]|nr:NUDIX domain-containing protein [Gemmatimonadota bacterium]